MTFEPDIVVSWDISEKDLSTITITSIKYDPKVKHLVGTVIDVIQGETSGAISLNQTMARHVIQERMKELQQEVEKNNEMECKRNNDIKH